MRTVFRYWTSSSTGQHPWDREYKQGVPSNYPQLIARGECRDVEPRQNLAGAHKLRNGVRGSGVWDDWSLQSRILGKRGYREIWRWYLLSLHLSTAQHICARIPSSPKDWEEVIPRPQTEIPPVFTSRNGKASQFKGHQIEYMEGYLLPQDWVKVALD